MVLHGQELPSAATTTTIQVIPVTMATVQIVAGKVVIIVPQPVRVDTRVAGTTGTVVVNATVVDHVVANAMTTVQTAAVVQLATVPRPVLVVSILEQETSGREIVHRFGSRLCR